MTARAIVTQLREGFTVLIGAQPHLVILGILIFLIATVFGIMAAISANENKKDDGSQVGAQALPGLPGYTSAIISSALLFLVAVFAIWLVVEASKLRYRYALAAAVLILIILLFLMMLVIWSQFLRAAALECRRNQTIPPGVRAIQGANRIQAVQVYATALVILLGLAAGCLHFVVTRPAGVVTAAGGL